MSFVQKNIRRRSNESIKACFQNNTVYCKCRWLKKRLFFQNQSFWIRKNDATIFTSRIQAIVFYGIYLQCSCYGTNHVFLVNYLICVVFVQALTTKISFSVLRKVSIAFCQLHLHHSNLLHQQTKYRDPVRLWA